MNCWCVHSFDSDHSLKISKMTSLSWVSLKRSLILTWEIFYFKNFFWCFYHLLLLLYFSSTTTQAFLSSTSFVCCHPKQDSCSHTTVSTRSDGGILRMAAMRRRSSWWATTKKFSPMEARTSRLLRIPARYCVLWNVKMFTHKLWKMLKL